MDELRELRGGAARVGAAEELLHGDGRLPGQGQLRDLGGGERAAAVRFFTEMLLILPNSAGLVLGSIEADFCETKFILRHILKLYKICALLHRSNFCTAPTSKLK